MLQPMLTLLFTLGEILDINNKILRFKRDMDRSPENIDRAKQNEITKTPKSSAANFHQ